MQILSVFVLVFAFFSIACDAAPISSFDISNRYDVEVDLSARTLRPVPVEGILKMILPTRCHPPQQEDFTLCLMVPMWRHIIMIHVYSAAEVNAQAQRFMQTLPGAHTKVSNRRKKSTRTYPKLTSGFRPSEAPRDSASGHALPYHYPMKGSPGNAPVNAHTGRTSMRVGTDRLMA